MENLDLCFATSSVGSSGCGMGGGWGWGGMAAAGRGYPCTISGKLGRLVSHSNY